MKNTKVSKAYIVSIKQDNWVTGWIMGATKWAVRPEDLKFGDKRGHLKEASGGDPNSGL